MQKIVSSFRTYHTLNEFYNNIIKQIERMYNTFVKNYWLLPNDLKVYRCLVLEKRDIIRDTFSGFTSCSCEENSALQFVIHPKKSLDLRR